MNRRYTTEQKEWLKSFIPGHKQSEIAETFTKTFGIEMTPSQAKSFKNNYNVKSGTSTGNPVRTVWTDDRVEFLKAHAKGNDRYKLAEMLTKEFGVEFHPYQVKSAMGMFQIRNELDCRFQYGRKPNENSIKKGEHRGLNTEFKKGNSPSNKQKIGDIVRRGDGYLWIKVREDCLGWVPLKRYVWEKHNGPIPAKHCIISIDGDNDNCDISNLAMINRSENAILTHKTGLRKSDPELAKTGILIARLIASNSKSKKKIRRTKNESTVC